MTTPLSPKQRGQQPLETSAASESKANTTDSSLLFAKEPIRLDQATLAVASPLDPLWNLSSALLRLSGLKQEKAPDQAQSLAERVSFPSDQDGFTVATPLGILWGTLGFVQNKVADWRGNNTARLEAFSKKFASEGLSIAQQAAFLFEHKSLGWKDSSEGAVRYYQELFDKTDFSAVLGGDLESLIQALHHPEAEKSPERLGLFRDALRSDAAYLQSETERHFVNPNLSLSEKMVHFGLFLGLEGVVQEQASALLSKLSEKEQNRFQSHHGTWEKVLAKPIDELAERACEFATPLAQLQVIQPFQETFQDSTIRGLYNQIPKEILERHGYDAQDRAAQSFGLNASVIVSAGTNPDSGWTSSGKSVDHILKNPSGEVAKKAVQTLISTLQNPVQRSASVEGRRRATDVESKTEEK